VYSGAGDGDRTHDIQLGKIPNSSVTKPIVVRYAFGTIASGCNLHNNEELPVTPHRTDSW